MLVDSSIRMGNHNIAIATVLKKESMASTYIRAFDFQLVVSFRKYISFLSNQLDPSISSARNLVQKAKTKKSTFMSAMIQLYQVSMTEFSDVTNQKNNTNPHSHTQPCTHASYVYR